MSYTHNRYMHNNAKKKRYANQCQHRWETVINDKDRYHYQRCPKCKLRRIIAMVSGLPTLPPSRFDVYWLSQKDKSKPITNPEVLNRYYY